MTSIQEQVENEITEKQSLDSPGRIIPNQISDYDLHPEEYKLTPKEISKFTILDLEKCIQKLSEEKIKIEKIKTMYWQRITELRKL